MAYNLKHFYENRFFFADASVFNVFTFPLVQGDSQTALSDPYTVVLTKTAAQKYFGNADPVGKSLTLNWRGEKYPFKITGVLQKIPGNSHFQFDFLASFISLKELWSYRPVNLFEHWGNSSCYTYLLVSENFSPAESSRIMWLKQLLFWRASCQMSSYLFKLLFKPQRKFLNQVM